MLYVALHLGKMSLVPIVYEVIVHLVLERTSHSHLHPDLLTGLQWLWNVIHKDVREV